MIFVTTGTQLPFPRLIQALDALAPDLSEPVIAQIGEDPGPYPNLETHAGLAPDRFEALFTQARIVVAHAGIGTILSAKRHGKPLILVPRQHALGEHRNDHQMATAAQMADHAGLYVVTDIADLESYVTRSDLAPAQMTDGPHLERLTGYISGWIEGG